jgi:alpha-beta hydrolase superfamily lysophospholipase
MRRPLRLLLVLAILSAAASLVTGAVVAEMGLHPPRVRVSEAETREATAIAHALHATLDEVSVQASDGVTLRGWLFSPGRSTRAAVIVAHGVAGHRGHALPLARLLVAEGYAVLAPDARGHGESGGIASFGVRERDDVKRWIDLVASRHPRAPVAGIGASMGAAELLQAAAEDSRIRGVVAEASFGSFREVAYDRIGQWLGTGPWFARTIGRPVVEAAFLYARLRYGLDLARAAPAQSVRAIDAPILLIHGTADHNLPLRHAHMIAEANLAVRLWIVEGAGHTMAWAAAPDEFPRRIRDFMRDVAVPR